jgi:hypothetical protein
MSFTCPKCWRTSYSAEDEQWGYCGNCHAFTGAINDGIYGRSSGGNSAGQEGEMRMQPDNEEQKAKPEMPEVQGEGNCDGLRYLRGQRMESEIESLMHPMSGDGVSAATDPVDAPIPPSSPYPSKYRFYWGAVGMGMGLGITWTVGMTCTAVSRYISRGHAITFLYLVVALCFVSQSWMLYRWNKALTKHRAEMKEYWDKNFGSKTNPFKGKI